VCRAQPSTSNAAARVNLLDDCHGPGAFLTQLRNLLPKETTIVGADSCPEYVCLARLDAVGRRACVIESLDTLTELRTDENALFDATLGVPAEGYDLIVGNPPYVRSQLLAGLPR
jgi:methylase of polypeptide subunit release factors